MIKALFIVGQCIRFIGFDPWQDPTYRITEVGKYSYNTKAFQETGDPGVWESKGSTTIEFSYYAEKNNQKRYESVTCPPIGE